MNIQLNGQKQTISATTIEALVAELKLNSRQVAIEKNREIVPKSTYAATALNEGDAIEIVAFVGGG